MICDDTDMIIGSANINDRSLWGSRDSELASYITGEMDLEYCNHRNNHTIKVNKKIHELRTKIFTEHFGLDEKKVIWPADEYFWRCALNIAKINTQFYDRVFKVLPSNKYSNYKSLEKRKKKYEGKEPFDPKAFQDLRPLVSGHAVCYPYKFLMNEHLESSKGKELSLWLAPYRVFI